MTADTQSVRRRLHGVVLVGGDSRSTIEHVVRGLPSLDAAFILSCAIDAPGLEALRSASSMPMLEARDGAALENGQIVVVPTADEARVIDGKLEIRRGPGHGPNGNTDRFLRSIADDLGRNSLVVVLPGAGADVEHGIKRVKKAGGLTIQLVPDLDGHGSTPAHDVASSPADLVLSVSELPIRLAALDRNGSDDTLFDEEHATPDAINDALRELLTLVRIRTGHDFSSYKRPTLHRRVARRMQVCQCETIKDYHRVLRDDPAELGRLLRDFLISVTNFFRDPEAFRCLEGDVIPRMFQHRGHEEQVRVWVAGCATGEEAYSVAMLLAEHAASINARPPQVFATDIDEASLTEARAGRYPDAIAIDVSAERLERFFEHDAGSYRVRKELREMILFSPHNVLRDPPFSRLDLVTCRNLLIYLNRDAQDRVLNAFHFGLRQDGYLFLGSSETAESVSSQFGVIDAKHRVYARRLATSSLRFDSVSTSGRWPVPAHPPVLAGSERTLAFGEMHHRVVEQYAPPSVLLDDELDVIHISEHGGRYLMMGGGEPTRNLFRLALPPLRLDLRTAIYAARQSDTGSDTRVVRFDDDGKARAVQLATRVVQLPELDRRLLLVTFDEREAENEDPREVSQSADPAIEPVVREIEDELHRTREQLRTTIEQYETSLEELKASNEELHAINEELRSATEELETSKEEQQSINEEIITVNHELKSKIDELSRANSDLQNLMTSTDIGVVFLDRNLDIKRFTPRAQELINVIASDIGRPLAHLTHRLDYDGLPAAAQTVLQTLRVFEREVRSTDGQRFLVRLLPYRSLEDRIEGVVLTFVDVTDLRAAENARRVTEAALQTSEHRLRLALRSAPLVAFSQDADLRFSWGYILGREVEIAGKTDHDMFGEIEGERLVATKREILTNRAGVRVELPMTIDGQDRIFDFRIEPIEEQGAVTGLRSVGFDITPSKIAEAALRDADARKDQLLATISHELRAPLAPLRAALDIQRLAPGDTDRVDRARAVMERQIAHLVRLVDDLLDVSRITENKFVLERAPVDVAMVFQAAAESIRPAMEQQGHVLVLTPPPGPALVLGDEMRLVQVVVNLLTNAAKFTPRGGRIELFATAGDPATRTITIGVRDDGIGMEAALLPRVFDLFVQGQDVAGRSSGGLGIGLNLARRLIELHGGTIAAHSDGPGHGSEIRVQLPLAPDDAMER